MLKTALTALALTFIGIAAPAKAAELAKPAGDVVLTVTGKIGTVNSEGAALFDLPMLEALAGRKSNVETPWYPQKVSFEGPLGSALLDAVSAKGTKLKVVALNDYAAEIPVEDFRKWPVILATKLDGKPMSVREKGPIFVIYPFDADPSLFNEQYFSRSVWQVKAIEVQ
jgi:hypothetical protein